MNGDDQGLDWLRAAFTAPAQGAPEPHPEADTIWSAVRGELPPSELREVVEHTAMCASCAEDWRLAAEFERQAAVETAKPAPNVVYGRFRQLAADCRGRGDGGGYPDRGRHPDVRPAGCRTRTGLPQRAAHRGALAPPRGPGPPRQAAVLRWSPVPGASLYNVQATTEDLQVVASQESLTGTEYRLPAEALSKLPAGSQLLWQVEAVFPDGTRQTSETFFTPLQ